MDLRISNTPIKTPGGVYFRSRNGGDCYFIKEDFDKSIKL